MKNIISCSPDSKQNLVNKPSINTYKEKLVAVTAAITLSSLLSTTAVAQTLFPPVLDLSEWDGDDGFVVNTADIRSVGDINADGIDDFIIPSPGTGTSYVIFGSSLLSYSGNTDLATLDGSNGFAIQGFGSGGFSGGGIGNAGDINGDGINDLILSDPGADPNGINSAGQSYIVFGGSDVGGDGVVNLSSLNGSNGFVVNGSAERGFLGCSVNTAGDVNADGIDDVIIAAAFAGTYVLFGGNSVGSNGVVELSGLNGSNGFLFDQDSSGCPSISTTGDINADGVTDMVVTAFDVTPSNGVRFAGASYIFFGGGSVGGNGVISPTDFNGGNGFVINGTNMLDRAGSSVSNAGDFNNDGVSDIVIGGSVGVYVVFGDSSIGSSGTLELSTLDGSNGISLTAGQVRVGGGGYKVSDAGDLNNDGLDDIVIGLPSRDSGITYVVFGGNDAGDAVVVDLTSLDGSNGFSMNGVEPYGTALGQTVQSAGDINGDGLGDIIISAATNQYSSSYVVFGRSNSGPSPDSDGDGIIDDKDNCVNVSNSNQLDVNGDGIGDACQSSTGNIKVTDINDWGTGYIATVEYTIESQDTVNGSLDRWRIDIENNRKGEIELAWMISYRSGIDQNGGGKSYSMTNKDQPYRPRLSEGDTLIFQVLVRGENYSNGQLTFNLVALDQSTTPPPSQPRGSAKNVAVDDWYNAKWGGGYIATYACTLGDDDVKKCQYLV